MCFDHQCAKATDAGAFAGRALRRGLTYNNGSTAVIRIAPSISTVWRRAKRGAAEWQPQRERDRYQQHLRNNVIKPNYAFNSGEGGGSSRLSGRLPW